MKFALLKKVRVALTLAFFLFTATVFLDFTNLLSPGFYNTVTFLQFIPSLLKFFSLFSIAGIGFIIILVLTLLFGRIYCSTICPLGAIQDIISFIARKFKKNKFYYHVKEQVYLRYINMLVSFILAFSGFVLFINLLDPFSNSGKILVNLARPLLISGNNFVSSALEAAGSYAVYPYELKNVSIINLLYPAIFLCVIFFLVFKNGRLFCNWLCPVGSLLGFVSKFSFIKITIDENSCLSCKSCERVCKSGCIDKENKNIDFSRCVSCYNCFTVCPSGGITFKAGNHIVKNKNSRIKKKAKVDDGKRKFVSKTVASFLLLAGLDYAQLKIVPKKKSTIPAAKKHPVTPPGSHAIERFNDKCTACHLCVSACPSQVLQPSLLEYGLAGIFQPMMDYRYGYCNFDCTLCSEVCPSGAITALVKEKKKLVQIGKAHFIKENCIVYTENTACGACSEHCPTKAVDMVPYKDINIPQVNTDYCTGCGACEHACPTQPHKSIYVDGNPVHLTAVKKPDKKIEQKVQEDFPF
jgi:ferredoxin